MLNRIASLLRTSIVVSLAVIAMSAGGDAFAKDRGIGIVTGPRTGTYIAFGKDISSVAKTEGVTLQVKESRGSIDNIKRISSGENVSLGIVQSDVLGFLKRSKNPESVKIAQNLRMVLPFYKEEIHVLARDDIQSLRDLQGKSVVVGNEGSGSLLTSVNLFSMMDVSPKEMLKVSPPEGLVAVLKGKADAIVFVGGKPVRLFKNLEDLQKQGNGEYAEMLKHVHFLALNDPKMLKEYSAAEITPQDYNFVTEPTPTIAVNAVLVSYDFAGSKKSFYKTRCQTLGKIGDAIRNNIDQLKINGHPKWKEVDLNANVGLWKKDGCIAQALHAKPKPGVERELLKQAKKK